MGGGGGGRKTIEDGEEEERRKRFAVFLLKTLYSVGWLFARLTSQQQLYMLPH